MDRPITVHERRMLQRRAATEDHIRKFLHGVVSSKTAMWTGLHPSIDNLGHLVTLITSHMVLLAEITTGRDWREFGEVCPWGNTDFHCFINKEETWEQNADRLRMWIERYETWLESTLDRVARAAADGDATVQDG